jgi:hypothetical protein
MKYIVPRARDGSLSTDSVELHADDGSISFIPLAEGNRDADAYRAWLAAGDKPAAAPPVSPAPTTASVSAFQAREALRLTPDPLGGKGTLEDAVEAYVAAHAHDHPTLKNAWDWIDPWERDSPFVLGLGEAFGMSAENIDALFALAATIAH